MNRANVASEPDWEAIYRASAYGFALEQGGWHWFALDGSEAVIVGPQRSVTLITAWNPNSVEHTPAWNHAAQGRLEAELRAACVRFTPAAGASLPGVSPAWREEGCALHDVDRAAACAWGLRFGQRALVRMELDSAELLFSADGRRLRCGVRALAGAGGE